MIQRHLYNRLGLTHPGRVLRLCALGLLFSIRSQAQTAPADTVASLEVNFPHGTLSIKKAKDHKISWRLSDPLSRKRDTLLVLESQGKKHQLYLNPKAGERIIPDSTFIQVPSGYQLHLRAGRGGLNLQGLEGKLEGQALSGMIKGAALKGTVNLYTEAGNVWLKNAQLEGLVGTGKGDVLLENVGGDIEGFSRQGKVSRQFTASYFKNATTPFRLNVDQADVQLPALPQGGEVSLNKGNLSIQSVAKKLQLTCGQGDVVIESLEAGLQALTQQGNLTLSLSNKALTNADTINLQVKSGTLTLNLPAAFSGILQVELLQQGPQAIYRVENAFAQVLPPSPLYPNGLEESQQPGASHTTALMDASGKVIGHQTVIYQSIGSGTRLVIIRVEQGNIQINKTK